MNNFMTVIFELDILVGDAQSAIQHDDEEAEAEAKAKAKSKSKREQEAETEAETGTETETREEPVKKGLKVREFSHEIIVNP
jgi:hypothetical protein